MSFSKKIYIFGGGSIGLPLAGFLQQAGKEVVVVRTSRRNGITRPEDIQILLEDTIVEETVQTVSFPLEEPIDGICVITSKAFANPEIAEVLLKVAPSCPILILQNGLGIEQPFLDKGFQEIYRCVLFFTSQTYGSNTFRVRPVATSPIGVITGSKELMAKCVSELNTSWFPFRCEENIDNFVWKKAISNVVFNSICPLVNEHNGIFVENKNAMTVAEVLVNECLQVSERLGIALTRDEILEQIRLISKKSNGQFISTLQDLQANRQTEIEHLNLAIANIGSKQTPPIATPVTKMLGDLIVLKSQRII